MTHEEKVQQALEQNLAKMQEELNNLPALAGSEKQIQWAEDLRAHFLAKIRRNMDRGLYRDPRAMMQAVESAQQARATWWIDHRYEVQGG